MNEAQRSEDRLDRNVRLPIYESKATPEQQAENRQFYYEQFKVIKDQEKIGVPMQFVKIRCGCLKRIHWTKMYRCLYCGIWYCKECAEEHFGYKVA